MAWFNALLAKIEYFRKHYRLIFHLLIRTRSLGVNNKWIDGGINHSIFGKSVWGQLRDLILIYPLFIRFRHMKWRMGQNVGFVTKKENDIFFN